MPGRQFDISRPISISIVLHLLLALLAWAFAMYSAEIWKTLERIPQPIWVEVEPVRRTPEERVVQTREAEKSRTEPDSALLGKQNQKVDRQTVSKAPAGGLTRFGVQLAPTASDLEGARKSRQEAADQNWARVSGAGPSEYVKGIEQGETTLLSTREYVYFGYFQRIRDRLDRAWNRSLRSQLSKIYRRGRTIATDTDHTTKVLVTLNQEGAVTRVQVLEESGTRDLDDAAVKAFNEAGPFPNPPKGLMSGAGEVQIRWDFVLRT